MSAYEIFVMSSSFFISYKYKKKNEIKADKPGGQKKNGVRQKKRTNNKAKWEQKQNTSAPQMYKTKMCIQNLQIFVFYTHTEKKQIKKRKKKKEKQKR